MKTYRATYDLANGFRDRWTTITAEHESAAFARLVTGRLEGPDAIDLATIRIKEQAPPAQGPAPPPQRLYEVRYRHPQTGQRDSQVVLAAHWGEALVQVYERLPTLDLATVRVEPQRPALRR